MKRVLRQLLLLAVLLVTAAVASGCSVPRLTLSPQELYTLPKLPAKYTDLNTLISAILEGGAEYSAPISGIDIQPVQMKDLDGDGREEAVAFFRNAADEKPLKIYIFTAKGDDYEQTALIEGSGTGIYSILYNDLDGDGQMELTVGWRVSAELQVLSVYALRPEGPEELLRTNYVKCAVTDLDQNELRELVVLRADESGDGVADYYGWKNGSLSAQSSARISMTMAELSQQGRVTMGTLRDEVPALFVTGVTDSPDAITDILTVRDGELTNTVLSDTTGVSTEIAPYCALYPTDINNDGLTEVPRPMTMSGLMDETFDCQRIDWCSYDSQGRAETVLSTFHDSADGWYFQMPDTWKNRVLVSRGTSADEAVVTFYIWDGEGGMPEPFLRITTLTGTSREIKAVRSNRFNLSRQGGAIYVAELLEANTDWVYGLTQDEVRAAFSLIISEWTTSDY